MTFRAKRRGLWLGGPRPGLWLGAVLAGVTAPATAQILQATPGTGFGSAGVYREDAATALGRYLRVITASPRNLDALIGAGRAALQVGDAQAAIGFYARAEQISPRNGRVKAGLGSALVLLNQEQAALRYFDDATNLGINEAEIASDRGLAHDLRGSSKRAQRDYAIALKRGADDETTRRMALSMAISGERDAAMALLDPLLRRQDTAAWRARAFILAMTGDTAGANRAAESVMPASLAAGFAPFFRKLPSLRPGEKAAAVHFGLFPGEARPMRIDDLFNQAEVAARVALENSPRSATDAGVVDRSQGALGRVAARAADGEGQLAANLTPRVPEQRLAAVSTPRPNAVNIPTSRAVTPPVVRQPAASTLGRALSSVTVAPIPAPVPPPVSVPNPVPSVAAAQSLPNSAQTVSTAGTTRVMDVAAPTSTPVPGFGNASPIAFPTPRPAPVVAEPPASRLADISSTVREIARDPVVRAAELPASSVPASSSVPIGTTQGLPARPAGDVAAAATVTNEVARPVVATTVVPPPSTPKVEVATAAIAQTPPPASRPKVEAPVVKVAASRPKVEMPAVRAPVVNAAVADTKGGEASRIWVQVAGGADEKAFPNEWRRLKAKAPELLTTQAAWSTPLRATNRLLVGPFETPRAAQDFVNKLAPKGITAFAWTSPDGQAIAKLAAK